MEISKEYIKHIINTTQCRWTAGYLSALLDMNMPSRDEVAIGIITKYAKAKVRGIKAIRNQFGLSLKDAKHLVDEYYSSGKIIFPDDTPPDSTLQPLL
jgi:ribosomal protein L7/L12